MQKSYYVYLHCKPDGVPFYVGKGHGRRAYELKRDRNQYHKRILDKYGRENIEILVFPRSSEAEAHADEIKWIAELRKNGFELCNMTDGGEGLSNPSQEVRKKISDAAKEAWKNPGIRARTIATQKASMTDERRKELAARATGKIHSTETRAKQSASIKATHARPETKAKMVGRKGNTGMLGKKHTQEWKDASSARKLGKSFKTKNSPTDDDVAKMKLLRGNDLSYQRIADEIGFGLETVYRYCKGVKQTVKKFDPRIIVEEKIDVINLLRASGITLTAIAKEVGIGISTVHRIINKGATP